jgi:chromosome partitioning protein
VKTVAFFNNKGGVGKTSLVYHVSWMMSLLGVRTVVADLDPQANATSMFLSQDEILKLWDSDRDDTIYDAIKPLMSGVGDIRLETPRAIADRLYLLPGDLSLSEVEDQLSETWPKCLSGDERAFRVTTAFARIISGGATAVDADLVLIDVGPNLGAINRAALLAADFVIIPLSADMFSIQGLKNVGPVLRHWRGEWRDRLSRAKPAWGLKLPSGSMKPIGYVVSRFSILTGGPVGAFQKWLDRAPTTYRHSVLDENSTEPISIDTDPNKLARLKDYRSLMPMAQEARKPMFLLKPADGAIGGHQAAVQQCRTDFEALARRILKEIGLSVQERPTV